MTLSRDYTLLQASEIRLASCRSSNAALPLDLWSAGVFNYLAMSVRLQCKLTTLEPRTVVRRCHSGQ